MKMRACEIFFPRIFFFFVLIYCVRLHVLSVSSRIIPRCWHWHMQTAVSSNRSMTDLANSNDQVYPLSPSLSSISLSVVFKDIFQHTSFPIALFPLIHFPSPLLESALTTIYHLPLTNYRSLSSGLDSAWCLMLYDSSFFSFSFFIFFPVHFELKTSLFCLSVCHHRAGV